MPKNRNYIILLLIRQKQIARAFKRLIFCIFYLWLTQNSYSNPENYLPPKFQNYNLRDGLSNLSVHSICQDKFGYIWIGTASGLNRFNGYTFKHFFYNDHNVSLANNDISILHNLPDGNLFISARNTASIYNIKKEKFYEVSTPGSLINSVTNFGDNTYISNRNGGISYFNVSSLQIDPVTAIPKSNNIGTLTADSLTGVWGKSNTNSYIILYNPEQNYYEKYSLPQYFHSSPGGTMIKIGRDLLITNNRNFLLFNLDSKKLNDTALILKNLSPIENNIFNFISQVERDIFWFGTKSNGLFIFNRKSGKISNFAKKLSNSSLNSRHIVCAYKDMDDNVWLGTFDRGLDVAFGRRKNFNDDLNLHEFTKDKFITSIASDRNGTFYIGTRLEGLHLYNKKNKVAKILSPEDSFLKDKQIRSLHVSGINELWTSCQSQLYIYNIANKSARKIELPKPNNGLVCIHESKDKIFAGTDIRGILVFSLNGELLDTITRFGKNITQIAEKENGNLVIIAHGKGIFEFNYHTGKSTNLNHSLNNALNSIDKDAITCFIDSKENLWIGNFRYGLYRINQQKDSLSIYTMQDGLPSNDITAIVEDNFGNIWVSTAYGLSRINQDESITSYSYNEGLENIQFHQKAVMRDESGNLYFGGNFGLSFFNPKNILNVKPHKTEVLLEALFVSNTPVLPDDPNGILSEHLACTKHITLSHKHETFSIEFKGIDYVAPEKVKYAYKLEGFNEHWNYIGSRTIASFSNLKRGKYVFMVKAQNNNGQWSEKPTTLTIHIKPSPWLTTAAILGYLFIIVLLTYGTFKTILRAKLYKREAEIEHSERMREKDISSMKLRFFTNISHELRTPITLINGNIDFLLDELKQMDIVLNSASKLKYSTNKLLKLIDQILSFRKLENDALDLNLRDEEIVGISKDIIGSFQYTGKNKDIHFELKTFKDSIHLPLDKDKYEKIMNNLLSNALKFSHANGTIKIIIEKISNGKIGKDFEFLNNDFEYLKICVIDNGKGISEKTLPFVFDRYVQGKEHADKPDYSGTGIGLNFTKRLVDLHKGGIDVESITNKETCFYFVIPFSRKAYGIPEIQEAEENTDGIEKPHLAISPTVIGDRNKTVLLAEDDTELNEFISRALSKHYKVLSSVDGKEAFLLAQEHLPDIIISDLMMPNVNGLELCKLVREDKIISHTPLILLTAKAEDSSRIAGFDYGADEYLTKPFDLKVLLSRTQNLINQRTNLQAYYKNTLPAVENDVQVNNFELAFMKKANLYIEENYQQANFNINQLANMMNMSRTSFYRKFTSIAKVPPKDFLTNFRISKAIELIEKGQEGIGDISYLCGFTNQSLFSIAFKKNKGVSPLQYKKSIQNNG